MIICFKTCFVAPSILLIAGLSGQVAGEQEWQENRLLAPSESQELGERNGRIYIYDGLHEDTVDNALDTQFHRVQNMMFIRVRHTAEDGQTYADDDC